MSFSFTAVGSKAEVARQLRAHTDSDTIVAEVRRFLVRAIEAHEADTGSSGDFGSADYAYLVKASGHIGSPTTLNITVEPHWVTVPPVEVVEVTEGNDTDAEAAVDELEESPF